MEWVNQVLVNSLYVFVVEQADCHFENLIVFRCKNQGVLAARQINRLDVGADYCRNNLLLLLAHLVVEGVWQGSDLLVGVVRLTSRDVNHKLTFVTDDDKTLRVSHDLLDIETVTRIVIQRPLNFSIGVTQDNLTLVRSNKNPAIGQPAVSRVVCRNVTVFFLRNLSLLGCEVVVLLDVILVGLVAGYKNDILVKVAETNLCADLISSIMAQHLSRHAPLLINLPDVHGLLGLGTQRDQKLVILGAEGHRDEGLVLFDLGRADNLALF